MSNRSDYGSKGGGSMEYVPYQGEDEDEVWCNQTVRDWYIAKDRYYPSTGEGGDWCLFGTNFESSKIAWPRIRSKDHANSARGWGSRRNYFTTVNGSTYCVEGPRKQHKSKKRNRRSQAPSERKKTSAVEEAKRKARKEMKKSANKKSEKYTPKHYSKKSYNKKSDVNNPPIKSSKYRLQRQQEKKKKEMKQKDEKIYGKSRSRYNKSKLSLSR